MQFTLHILLATTALTAYAAPTADTSPVTTVDKRQSQSDVARLIKHCLKERGGSAKMWDCSKSKYMCDSSGMCWGICKCKAKI